MYDGRLKFKCSSRDVCKPKCNYRTTCHVHSATITTGSESHNAVVYLQRPIPICWQTCRVISIFETSIFAYCDVVDASLISRPLRGRAYRGSADAPGHLTDNRSTTHPPLPICLDRGIDLPIFSYSKVRKFEDPNVKKYYNDGFKGGNAPPILDQNSCFFVIYK